MAISVLFRTTIFFTFASSKSFWTGCDVSSSFVPVSKSFQTGYPFGSILALTFLPFLVYPLQFSQKFVDEDLYIKHPFPINKQFSIDSFIDWESCLLLTCHSSSSHLQLFARLTPSTDFLFVKVRCENFF